MKRLKLIFKLAIVLVVIYAAAAAALAAAMLQPPERFSRIMARLPGPVVFPVLPFKPLWMVARAGSLDVGDEAPDWTLETFDRKSRVRLSSHRERQLVVLVFGSYT